MASLGAALVGIYCCLRGVPPRPSATPPSYGAPRLATSSGGGRRRRQGGRGREGGQGGPPVAPERWPKAATHGHPSTTHGSTLSPCVLDRLHVLLHRI